MSNLKDKIEKSFTAATFSLLLFSFTMATLTQAANKNAMPLRQPVSKSNDGLIILDHGSKLVGQFHLQTVKNFFRITETKFPGKLYTKKCHHPQSENFKSTFEDFTEQKIENGKVLYRLTVANDFGNGLIFTVTNDQRLVVQDLYQSEPREGTIHFLEHAEYKKYVGEISNLTFEGVGKLELKNGQTLLGRFVRGTLHGIYFNQSQKKLVEYFHNKLVSGQDLGKISCQDPYLGQFYLQKGNCTDDDIITYGVNVKSDALAFNGHFKKGKLWSGEIVPLSLDAKGTFGKFENGKPSGIMRIQNNDVITIGQLQDGKLEGQIIQQNLKTGEKFIGRYQNGRPQGSFRILNYNGEALNKTSL